MTCYTLVSTWLGCGPSELLFAKKWDQNIFLRSTSRPGWVLILSAACGGSGQFALGWQDLESWLKGLEPAARYTHAWLCALTINPISAFTFLGYTFYLRFA